MPGVDGGFGVPGGAGFWVVVVVGATELEEGAALDEEAALLAVPDVGVGEAGWASPDFAPAGDRRRERRRVRRRTRCGRTVAEGEHGFRSVSRCHGPWRCG